MSFVGVDHVQIAAPAGCEEAARRFFVDLLGLQEVEKPEPLRARGGVWLQVGAQQLHIGVEEPFRAARKAHPALRVDPEMLEVLAERLHAAGITVLWDDELPDTRRFYTEDPWGNRLELLADRSGMTKHDDLPNGSRVSVVTGGPSPQAPTRSAGVATAPRPRLPL